MSAPSDVFSTIFLQSSFNSGFYGLSLLKCSVRSALDTILCMFVQLILFCMSSDCAVGMVYDTIHS